MENFNTVPDVGSFGQVVSVVNANFQLAYEELQKIGKRAEQSRGLFPSVAALTTAYPTPKAGEWAYVGNSFPVAIYECVTDGVWKNSGATWNGESVDLTNYALKADTQDLLAKTGYFTAYNQTGNAAISITAPGFRLTAGGCMRIKTTNAVSTSTVTLNINSTGAKTLYYNGLPASTENSWSAGDVIEVYYDGTQYQSNVVNWRGVDDEPTAGSDNLVKSDGVSKAIEDETATTTVFTVRDCVLDNTLIKADGTLNNNVSGYCTSKKIPISKHYTKLMFYDVWNIGANVWRSLAIYDDNDTVIAYEGNDDIYGEIDLTALSNPSYFRFARNKSDIQEPGYTTCVVLISNDSKLDIISNNILANLEPLELSVIEFKNSNVVSNGYALQCDGNLVETSDNNHYTSGFYELFPSSTITATNTFIRSSKWAGIILYDKDKLPIATFGGNVNISIKEIPTAKYFRFFVTKTDNYTVRYTLPKSKDSSILRDNRSILTNNRLVYDNTYCTLANTGINYDGSLKTIDSALALNCTPKIPIGNAKYLMHYNIWIYGATTWCALAIYDKNDNILYRSSGQYNIINLNSLENPSYFRYVMSTGADFTGKMRYDKPVVILSMNAIFTEKEIDFDAIEYINLKTGYREAPNPNSNNTGWGFNYLSPADINVNNIEISYSSSHSNIGDVINCYVGSIDQRGWFILRTTVKLELVSQDVALNINYYKPMEGFVIKKNEICIVNCGYYINYNVLPSASEYGEMVNWEGGNASSLVIRNDHVCLCHFVISGDFADMTSSSSSTNIDMDEIEEDIKLSKVLTDESTGNRYEIIINNGILGIKDISIHNILVIGNSFTTHENASNVWWGNGRGMAASVDSTQYTEFIKRATGAELDILRGVDFERNYSTSFNFKEAFPINKNYDVVIVQLNENATYSSTMQNSWGALYDYIKTKVPNARIIQIIGNSAENKTKAITVAATQRGISVLNCTADKDTGKYWLGCYVTGADNNYYEIVNTGVSNGHPSDVGMYFIARRILRTLKYSIDNPMRQITVDEVVGATVTIPYNEWPVGGVVNVLCSNNISALNVIDSNGNTVQVTSRTNTHGHFYTFIMPNASVVITPTI